MATRKLWHIAVAAASKSRVGGAARRGFEGKAAAQTLRSGVAVPHQCIMVIDAPPHSRAK